MASIEYTYEDLRIMLEQLMKDNPDIQGAIVITVQGLPLFSLLTQDINEDLVSAMGAAILSMSKHGVEELNRGDLKRVLIEGNEGIIILLKALEDAILCLLARSDANLGDIFRAFDNNRGLLGVKGIPYIE